MQQFISCFKIWFLAGVALIGWSEVPAQVRIDLRGSTDINVRVVQDLHFGAFTQGHTGGTIQMSPDGNRQASGTVVPLNFGGGSTALLFEVEGPRGSIVSILSETTTLTGSNGGSMLLKITGTNPPMPFIITDEAPVKSIIKIAAELTVGNAQQSPPGNYSGSLNVSFIKE